MKTVVDIKNLSFSYKQNTVLKQLDIEISQGTFLAIAGPNGVGKTTLLKLIAGLLKNQNGSIAIEGRDIKSYSIRALAKKMAIVHQESVPVFDFTVEEVVAMARTPYLGTLGFQDKNDKAIIREALEITETQQFASRSLTQLSGGERQRVFIARALAQDTPVLLLDEPTSFLDLKHQVKIYDLLKTAQTEKGKTIVTVTHDINLAGQYCNDTLLLACGGKYHFGKTADIFTSEKIKEVFDVTIFTGQVGSEKFFLPLGQFAKDNQNAKT